MLYALADKRFDRIRIFRILFLFYCLTLFLLAILPINGVSSPLNHIFIVNIRLDYLFHSLVFIPWMLLISFAFANGNRNKRLSYILLWISYGLLTAIITEGIQYFIPYRSFNMNDLLANLIGVAIGIILLPFFKTSINFKPTTRD